MHDLKEIRIDNNCTSLLISKITQNDKKDTIPMIRDCIKSTKGFLGRIQEKLKMKSGDVILPLNCRYSKYYSDGSKMVILEDQPRVRTILVDLSMEYVIEKLKLSGHLEKYGFKNFLKENKKPYRFLLSFPYIVYIIVLNPENQLIRLEVFFRLSPISSKADYLLNANLLNISSKQTVCLGVFDQPSNITLIESCDNILLKFWSAIFNNDYISHVEKYAQKNNEVSDYLTWEYNTKKDPMFIFDVSWIPHFYTLSREICEIENNINLCNDSFNFYSLEKIFTRLYKIDEKEDKKEDKKELYENICESVAFENGVLSIGDSFILNKKEFFIETFIGNDALSDPLYVKVEDSEHNFSKLKIDRIFKSNINQFLENQNQIDFIKLKNNIIVKKGDILIVDFPFKGYKRVNKIKKARDGEFEIILNNDNYLAKNLEATIFDNKNPKFQNIKLKKNEIYILENNNYKLVVTNYIKATFIECNISIQNKIILTFKDNNNNKIRIPLFDSTNFIIHKITDCKLCPRIFRIGAKLFLNDKQKSFITKTKFLRNEILQNPSLEEVFKFCIDSSNKKFKVTSFDNEINFKIGDQVVKADWENPTNMFNIQTIDKFYFNKTEDIIEIHLKNKKGEIEHIPYIRKNKQFIDIEINIGVIRKIQTEYKGIVSGTKIRANKSQISNFPKKDINIIIGFLIDTGGEPLVLCSNCCTLWYSDLKTNFELIQNDSLKWKKLKHAPINLSKIKFQPGDFISIEGDSFLDSILYIYYNNILQIEKIRNFIRGNNYNSNFQKHPYYHHGFITPRYTKKQQTICQKFSGFPNFHGMYTKNNSSNFSFKQDREINIRNV